MSEPKRASPSTRARSRWIRPEVASGALARRIAVAGMIAALLAISVIAAVNAIRWVNKPFAGFLLTERMVVAAIAQPGWPGPRAGLVYLDKLVTANGRPIASMRDLDEVVETAGIGRPVHYRFDRGGRVFEAAIPPVHLTFVDLLMTFGLGFLPGLSYIVIAALVFALKPDARVTWAFLLACFFLSILALAYFDAQSTHWGFARLILLSDAFVGAAFVHLSLVFPEEKRWVRRFPRLQAVPYVASAVLAAALLILYPRPAFLPLHQVARLYALVAALAIVASALHAYFASSSPLARQRAKVVVAGALLAFPVPALRQVLVLWGDVLARTVGQNNLLTLPLAFFPAAIAYAIVKHNLFDVDVYLKRAVGYGIMTAAVGFTYFSLQTVLSTFVRGPVFGEARETVYPIVFAALVVFLFNPLNRRVQDAVDRVFFRRQFDYKKTVGAVSGVLTSMLDLGQIITQVISTIRLEMFVDTAGVVVFQPEQKTCQASFVGDDPNERRVSIGYHDPLVALLREERALVTRFDIEEDPRYGAIRDGCLASFSAMAATLAIPLLYQGKVTGFLALGQKKSGHFYSREDVELLTTMANQAAVAIANATTHEEVVRYAEELAASLRRIQILESIKGNLAKFVPRTVQELIEESPEAPSFDKREIDVSVLFADITGYTRLSAQMDLDHVNRLVERYFSAFLDEIMARGGDVNETAGDGLMVIFRKKDPRRHARAAVLAALGIQRRAREINAELAGQHEPIAMKVGVNSGIASVGATRIEGAAGTRWTYTASGPTTNVAARLAALAEGAGGGVIVSAETRARIGDEFQVEDLGRQTLKNVPEPLGTFRVVARIQAAPPGGTEATPRRLYVVSRDRPELYEDLRHRYEDVPDVEVIVDRRRGERRLHVEVPAIEKRQPGDRRAGPDVDAELHARSRAVPKPESEGRDPRPGGPEPGV